MQNSQPYPGFPRKARIAPRRARRGALMPAAVLAVLVITIVMSQFAQAQLRHASAARSESRAVQLAAIAADFDYYVHAKQVNPESVPAAFEDYLRPDVARVMPGFTLTYLAGRIDGGRDVYGGVLLKTDGASEVVMDTLLARLATYGAQDRVLDRDRFVQNVLGRKLTKSERVILTAPLSGIDPKYVLRMRRAGHPPPKLVGGGALDLGGHNLNVGTLTATGVNVVVVEPDPSKADDDTPPAPGLLQAESLTTLHLETKRLQTKECTGC